MRAQCLGLFMLASAALRTKSDQFIQHQDSLLVENLYSPLNSKPGVEDLKVTLSDSRRSSPIGETAVQRRTMQQKKYANRFTLQALQAVREGDKLVENIRNFQSN